MANKKVFTDESLATLIDETKSYVDSAVSTKSDSNHNHNDIYETRENAQEKYDAIVEAKANWNQNDEEALDFIKNRPFYETDPVETIIAEGTIPTNEMLSTSASVQFLTLGEKYTVIFDSTTYSDLICVDVMGLAGLGSADMSYRDYPFALAVENGTAMAFAGDGGSHYIKVIKYVSEVIPLERKFIAEHLDVLAGEKVEGKSYTVDEEQTVAKVGAEVFNDYDKNIATGKYSHVEGSNNIASGDFSHSEGYNTKATGMLSHAEGFEVTASGSYSHAEGANNIASGDYSHAEGQHSEATTDCAHAEGFASKATGRYSHAEGDNAIASGQGAHAEGYSAVASGIYSHAEGSSTIAASPRQHVQGRYNIEDAESKYAHIVGNGDSNSARSNAHTLDWSGNAWFSGDVYVGGNSQDDAIKLGQGDWNQHDESAVDHIKNRTHWTEANEITIVSENVSVSEEGYAQFSGSIPQLIVGQSYKVVFNGTVYECVARAWEEDEILTVLIGNGTIYGDGNEGNGEPFLCDSYAGNSLYLNTSVGEYNVSISTIKETVYPLDEKYIPYVTGKNVEGKTFTINLDDVKENVVASKGAEIFNDYESNVATGMYSHAEGSTTIASGDCSHAEGLETVASGYYAHAEGVNVEASGTTSHAEGTFTIASGFVSHVEGMQCKATHDCSHAEGFSSEATGQYSHAEGDNAIASGTAAHAEGCCTVASGNYSHAEGSSTIASSQRQHVQGKYNIEDTEAKYAHIVGNGESDTERSNAHTLDWHGNAEFQGDVVAHGCDGENPISLVETHNALNNYYLKSEADNLHTEILGYVDTEVAALVNSAPETLDTLGELATAFEENQDMVETLNDAITYKADKSELDEFKTETWTFTLNDGSIITKQMVVK